MFLFALSCILCEITLEQLVNFFQRASEIYQSLNIGCFYRYYHRYTIDDIYWNIFKLHIPNKPLNHKMF